MLLLLPQPSLQLGVCRALTTWDAHTKPYPQLPNPFKRLPSDST